MQAIFFYGSAVVCSLITIFLLPGLASLSVITLVILGSLGILWWTRNDEIGSLVGVIALIWGLTFFLTGLVSIIARAIL